MKGSILFLSVMKENDMLSTYYNDTNNKKYRSTCFTVIAKNRLDSFVLDSDFDKKTTYSA